MLGIIGIVVTVVASVNRSCCLSYYLIRGKERGSEGGRREGGGERREGEEVIERVRMRMRDWEIVWERKKGRDFKRLKKDREVGEKNERL